MMWWNAHFTLVTVLIGVALLGTCAGVLGCFAYLRGRALVGDALAHAALPGVCLAFLLTQSKHPLILIAGAASTGCLGSWLIHRLTRLRRIHEDTAIGLVLSVFFGIGIVLLTFIQHQPYGNQAGLDKFLFGQTAALLPSDVLLFCVLTIVLLLTLLAAYKEFQLLTFDREYAHSIGLPVAKLDALLLVLLVLIVTAGLQAVGVVLMSALLITPAAAARQWTNRLPRMLLIAGALGGTAGIVGALVSASQPRMPTGPWIVLVLTAGFGVSLLCAPVRGLLPRWWRTRRQRRRITRENALKSLYRLGEDAPDAPATVADMLRYRPMSRLQLLRVLHRLQREGAVRAGAHPDAWELTPAGRTLAATVVRRHRLWEVYLTRHLQIPHELVHADAEEIEHLLTPELEAELMRQLGTPSADPHAKPIPYPTEER